MKATTHTALAAALIAAAMAMNSGTAAAVTETGSASAPAGRGTLKVSFTDRWAGAGQSTWTIDSSRSAAEWVFVGPMALGQVQLTLVDEYCFAKYGLDSVSVSGSGISPGGVSAQRDCGTRRGTAAPDARNVTNSGNVVGRGNPYGRWLWMQHRSQASIRIGSANYFVEAYDRSAPLGGNV